MTTSTSSSEPLDLLTLPASSISHLLTTSTTTSAALITQYLDNIEANNRKGMNLNAIISTPDREILMGVARQRDEVRRRMVADGGDGNGKGRVLGPLWGVPIVLKDIMVTEQSLGMDTTCGSHAFVGAKAEKNAVIVQRLLDAGMIILGKANLTEFCGLKMGGISNTPGWSPVGGQTQSAHIEGGLIKGAALIDDSSAGGSSSGSAVAVSAGFSPLSIGTECVGSVTTPCTRAGVYALKTAPGSVPLDGCFALSETFDCFGNIGKSAQDVAWLTDVVLGSGDSDGEGGVLGRKVKSVQDREKGEEWEGLKVGFVDPRMWQLSDEICPRTDETKAQMFDDYEAAVASIRRNGADVTSSVVVDGPEKCKTANGKSPFHLISFAYVRQNFKAFCSNFSTSNVQSLADIIEWNKQHPELELPPDFPNQDDLIAAQEDSSDMDEVARAIVDVRKLGTETLDNALDSHGLDIIAGPADSALCMWPAAAAYPTAIVPYGTLKSNGRPFGICAIAKAGGEEKLVQFMAAWERAFPERPLPAPLIRKRDELKVAETLVM